MTDLDSVELESTLIWLAAPIWLTAFAILVVWGAWNDSREERDDV